MQVYKWFFHLMRGLPVSDPGRFQRQLTQDQTQALQPDVTTPFRSRKDAVMRLIRYHVFSSIEPSELQVAQGECF